MVRRPGGGVECHEVTDLNLRREIPAPTEGMKCTVKAEGPAKRRPEIPLMDTTVRLRGQPPSAKPWMETAALCQ
jgi:hypothetical protein